MKKIIIFIALIITIICNANGQTTYTVIKTTDPDPYLHPFDFDDNHCDPDMLGTLQWAIRKSLQTPGNSIIAFNISGTGPFTIQLNYSLPVLEKNPVTIDGTTQPGYTAGNPQIYLDGNYKQITGLYFNNLKNSSINGILFTHFISQAISFNYCDICSVNDCYFIENGSNESKVFPTAIRLIRSSHGTFSGNFIGMAPNGNAVGNQGFGIVLTNNSNGNVFGGTNAGKGNTIVNNLKFGIWIVENSIYNKISGNIIYGQDRAIVLEGGGNQNKHIPEITTYNLATGTLSGISEAYDTIEIFGSTGNESANEYLAKAVADAHGDWVVNNVVTTYNFVIATAKDAINNTSALSTEFQISFPITKLIDSDCGASNISPSQVLSADSIPGAAFYKFIVSNDSMGYYSTIIKPTPHFSISNLPEPVSFSMDLNVAVQLVFGSDTGSAGPICHIQMQSNFPLLRFSLTNDTLNVGEYIKLYNESLNFANNESFYWDFNQCSFSIDDSSNICNLTTIGLDSINGYFTQDGFHQITLYAIDQFGNIIQGIWPFTKTVYVKLLNPLVCGAVSCHDATPWDLCQFICNGNFEYYSSCPNFQGQLCRAEPWQISHDVNNVESSSPDYYNACFGNCLHPPSPIYSCMGVPINDNSQNQPSHNGGSGYGGFIAVSNGGGREYLQQPLRMPLTPGLTYHIEMYISHDGRSDLACSGIRLYFTQGQPIQTPWGLFPSINTAQLSPSSGLITSHSWVLYSADFTVPSGSTNLDWVTIGVFDASVSITTGNYDNYYTGAFTHNAYYFIDDVSIKYAPHITATANPTSICSGGCTNLTASGWVTTYIWMPGNLSGATVNVCPSTTTNYTVTGTTSYGCSNTATVTVQVNIPELSYSYSDECQGNATSFYGTATNPSCIASWSWDFGDPASGMYNSSNLQNPQHYYTEMGTYTVTMGVTDIYGQFWSTQFLVTMHLRPTAPVIPNFVNNNCDGNWYQYNITPEPDVTYAWTISPCTSNCTFTGTTVAIDWSQYALPATLSIIATNTITGCTDTALYQMSECCHIPPLPGSWIPALQLNNTSSSELIAAYQIPNNTLEWPYPNRIIINGDFVIDQSFTFLNCYQINFGPMASIHVMPGRTLTIQNSTLQAGCDYMWDGIYMYGNTSSLVFESSTAMDAINAIVSDHGGDFSVRNSTLKNNHIAIVVKNFIPPGSLINHPGKIYNTTITTNVTNLPYPPFQNQAANAGTGIYVNKVKNFTIGVINQGINYFSNLKYGVESHNSMVTLIRNDFTNFVSSPSCPVYATGFTWPGGNLAIPSMLYVGGVLPNYKNSFSNSQYGIIAMENLNVVIKNKNSFSNVANAINVGNLNMNNSVLIDNNIIQNTERGIYTYFNPKSNITISNNDISLIGTIRRGIYATELTSSNPYATYSILNNTINNCYRGIMISNLSRPRIETNKIWPGVTSSASNPVRGIEINACYRPYVFDNDIKRTAPASSYWIGGIISSLSPQTTMSCNRIEKLGYAIQCCGAMQPSWIKSNTMTNCYTGIWLSQQCLIGTQGSTLYPSGNRWTGSFTRGTYTSGITYGFNSPFNIHTPPPVYNSPSNYNEYGSFIIPFTNVSGQNESNCPIHPRSKIGLGIRVATNQIGFGANEQEAKWLSKKALYTDMLYDASMADSSIILRNFKDSADIAPMGILDSVSRLIANPMLSIDTSGNRLFYALMLNSSTDPLTIPELKSKTLNEIVLSRLISCNNYFTTVQLDDLRTIAAECPFISGIAVYQARAILAVIDSFNIEYLSDCEVDIQPNNKSMESSEEQQNNPLFELYPNPAKDNCTLVYFLEPGQSGSIEFYNLIGEKVYSTALIQDEISLDFSTESFNEGVYLYRILVNSEVVYTNKLVIIK
jgi:hypothetical protein